MRWDSDATHYEPPERWPDGGLVIHDENPDVADLDEEGA